jgi:hypothetical protein
VVLEEEVEEFLLMAPLALVVVLDGVRLACGGLRWSALRQQWKCEACCQGHNYHYVKNPAHDASMIRELEAL